MIEGYVLPWGSLERDGVLGKTLTRNLFRSDDNLAEIESNLNRDLELFTLLFQVNLLSLNVSKTSYIIFGSRMTYDINLMMQGAKLERAIETKFLGVLISHKLSWKSHFSTVCSKMSKKIGIIARMKHLLTTDQVLRLYHTLVEPYMSYCCIVWAGINKTVDLNRIHIIQKRYCRFISFSNSRASSAPLFKSLKILNVYDLFRYQASLCM